MGESSSTMWLFLKNFSTKFSISDLVNGNDKKSSSKGSASGSNNRKYNHSYNKLGTNTDKEDFLSSSNPNLFDIVGKEEEDGTNNGESPCINANNYPKPLANKMTASLSTSALKSKPGPSQGWGGTQNPAQSSSSSFAIKLGSLGLGSKSSGGSSKDKKYGPSTQVFSFPKKVPSYTQEQEKVVGADKEEGCWDNEEDLSEGTSSCNSSDYEDEDEKYGGNENRCGICGCEKKYEVVTPTANDTPAPYHYK